MNNSEILATIRESEIALMKRLNLTDIKLGQPSKCLRGEHETGGSLVFPAAWMGATIEMKIPMCVHCRCLYVERS